MANAEQGAQVIALVALSVVTTVLVLPRVVFGPSGIVARFDQRDEGEGFDGAGHETTMEDGASVMLARTSEGWSLRRDVDSDGTPDIHEWSNSSGRWIQDTRDYKGAKPRNLGPPAPL